MATNARMVRGEPGQVPGLISPTSRRLAGPSAARRCSRRRSASEPEEPALGDGSPAGPTRARRRLVWGYDGWGSSELPILRTPESRRCEVLQRVRREPRGADHHPRAALLHAAPSRREDPRVPERAQGRAQAGHRPLRRRGALDGARGARGSRGVASPPRSPVPGPSRRRPPIRGDHQPVHRRRHHGALRRPDRSRGPRPARLCGRPRSGGRPRRARRRRAARERARARRADGPELRRGRRGADRGRPAHGLHRAGARRRARRPGAAAGAAGRRRRDRRDRAPRGGLLRLRSTAESRA